MRECVYFSVSSSSSPPSRSRCADGRQVLVGTILRKALCVILQHKAFGAPPPPGQVLEVKGRQSRCGPGADCSALFYRISRKLWSSATPLR
jgi:hypothetical protein